MIEKIFIDQYEILESKGFGQTNLAFTEELDIIGNTIQLPEATLTIHDPGDNFNPIAKHSIFWNRDYTSLEVRFVDEIGTIVYSGNIKNIITDSNGKQVTIEIDNGVRKIFESKLEYIADVSDALTPAEIFKGILIINGLKDFYDVATVESTISYQKQQGYYIGYSALPIDGITIGEALEQLALISGADVYYSDRLLFLKHYPQNSTVRIAGENLTADELLDTIIIEETRDYIRNNYSIDIQGITDTTNQTYTDITFNNIGAESRNLYGQNDLNTFDLNSDNKGQYMAITSNSIISAITAAENWMRRFSKPLMKVVYKLQTSTNRRYRLGEYIKLDISDINLEISDKLLYIVSITREEENDATQITAIEEINPSIVN